VILNHERVPPSTAEAVVGHHLPSGTHAMRNESLVMRLLRCREDFKDSAYNGDSHEVAEQDPAPHRKADYGALPGRRTRAATATWTKEGTSSRNPELRV
jgi:hypothetical protein